MKIYFFLIVITLHLLSCKGEESRTGEKIDISEDEYYRVQGIVTSNVKKFNYQEKFRSDIHYIYFLELDRPMSNIANQSDLVLNPGDPIAIMVHKNDSSKTFIAHRGIIQEELLMNYLTRENSDYLNRLDNN